MTNEIIAQKEQNRITEFKGAKAININSYSEALSLATAICKTGFVPKAYVGKPQDAAIAMIYGMEVGLPPMASLQNIAVVNGQPSIWGDGMLALVQNSGLLKEYKQSYQGEENTDSFKAVVEVSRKDNNITITAEFSVADAKAAGLWGKVGTWKSHPKRMLMYKARAFALRDCFPDVLKGLHSIEEMQGERSIIDITEQSAQTQTQQSADNKSNQESQHNAEIFDTIKESLMNSQNQEELENNYKQLKDNLGFLKDKEKIELNNIYKALKVELEDTKQNIEEKKEKRMKDTLI